MSFLPRWTTTNLQLLMLLNSLTFGKHSLWFIICKYS